MYPRAAKHPANGIANNGTCEKTSPNDFDNALNQIQFALSLSGNSFQTSETIMTKIKLAKERLGRRRGF